jgi:hypothetical protein
LSQTVEATVELALHFFEKFCKKLFMLQQTRIDVTSLTTTTVATSHQIPPTAPSNLLAKSSQLQIGDDDAVGLMCKLGIFI